MLFKKRTQQKGLRCIKKDAKRHGRRSERATLGEELTKIEIPRLEIKIGGVLPTRLEHVEHGIRGRLLETHVEIVEICLDLLRHEIGMPAAGGVPCYYY
jgi:hypothetical protein